MTATSDVQQPATTSDEPAAVSARTRVHRHRSIVMWLTTMTALTLYFVAPNNVARTLAGRQATPETISLIKQRLGLDHLVWQQYLDIVGNAVHGDLGFDYKQIPVTEVPGEARPITLSLAIGAGVIWLLSGVSNGVGSANASTINRRSRPHRLRTVALLGADVSGRGTAAVLVSRPAGMRR